MKSKAYVILGISGSGKDTQAGLLSEYLGNLPVVSTGEILRKKYKEGTRLGIKADEYSQRGEWVPDDLMLTILKEYLSGLDLTKGIILTGYPRTIGQVTHLDELLSGRNIDLQVVFHLDTSEATAIDRIRNRISEVVEERSDDVPEKIKARIKGYNETIQPILECYARQGKLVRINNQPGIGEVFENIKRSLEDDK